MFKNKPAPDNLRVPPHMYVAGSDNKLVIGEDKNEAETKALTTACRLALALNRNKRTAWLNSR